MKKSLWLAAAVSGFLLLAALALACRPNQTVERQTDDAGIKTSVKAKLAADVRFSTLTAVSVDVTNGIVTLAGPVHSSDEKQKIEEAARSVKGVVGVTNNLQVEPSIGVTPAVAAATPPAAQQPVSLTPPVPVVTP
jgi:hypothetical protein